ncbi:MAG: pyridoxal phosphate-dependent aminotransferase [Acidobacteria bacterium]|nr:pyridoxal phosphate-dependent aminotransferase [Acidobacteriota bacterium]
MKSSLRVSAALRASAVNGAANEIETDMFSSRIHWDLRPNRLSEVLEQRRRSGAKILDLTESNPTLAGLAYAADEILPALSDMRSLFYHPAPRGLEQSREAVCGYYASRGVAVEPGRVLLTTSTSESYAQLFKLLADPGDEVLVPRPSYPLFEFLATLESVRIVHYRLAYDGQWHIDFDSITRALTSRTRAIILVNPNNPTGSFLKTDELERLIALANERRIAIISDEVFADYALAPDPARVASIAGLDSALTFALSGLSKIAGLPQMKLGWIVIGGPAGLRAQATERLELIADTYLSVSTPIQLAFPKLLAAGKAVQQQIGARVRLNLEFLRGAFGKESACGVLETEGGWYAILRVPRTRSEEEWTLELLSQDNVLVQPGFFYDFESEAFLVLSLLAPPEPFSEGVRRLAVRVEAVCEAL